MAWTVGYNPTLEINEILFTGEITASDMREATTYAISLGKEKDTHLYLLDATEMELAATFMDIYEIPDKQYFKEATDRRGRVAVVLPTSPKAREAMRFYETVSKNRGWMVLTFPERQDSTDWLVSGKSSNKLDSSAG